MRPLVIALVAWGCSSSSTLPARDGAVDMDVFADDASMADLGSPEPSPDAGFGWMDAAADAGVDGFVPTDAGPVACEDHPTRVHAGDFVVGDEASLREALELTAVEGTLSITMNGVIALPRLRRAEVLALGSEAGPIEFDAPCLRELSVLSAGYEVTMTSPPLAVEQATVGGTVDLPSLERAAELRGSGDLRLSGLRWVGEARISPRSLSVPVLREAGWLRIVTPGRRPTRGDAPVNLPSLLSVDDLTVDTAGGVRVGTLRTAGAVSVVASHAEFPSLEDSGIALVFHRLPDSAGLLDLPSLQSVERLWVTAHEPSTVRAPVLTEVVNLELRHTTPEMIALERADDVFIWGASGFELPALRRVVELSLIDVISTRALEFAFGGLTADHIPTVDLGGTRAPAFRLLGTSLIQLSVDRSAIPEVAIPNAPTVNGVTISESEVHQLLLSAPPSAYWISILDVVGITQCECEALAPYVIDDGYMGPSGDHRCEGLVACE